MNYVPREKEPELKRLIDSTEEHKNVILVDGARQVGKSRLVEHVLQSNQAKKIEINLEVDSLIRSKIDECLQFNEFYDLLVDEFGLDPNRKTIIYIDEAQESMKLGGFVRSMKEQWTRVTVILTGSSLSRLFRPGTRYPVGRVTNLTIRPFSFSEYLQAVGRNDLAANIAEGTPEVSRTRHETLLRHLDRYLLTGGLPDIVSGSIEEDTFSTHQRQMLAAYEQDFRRLFGEDRLHLAQDCLRSVANLVGFPSKLSSVAPNATTKVINDVKKVFVRLEEWHMIFKSLQFGPSVTASHDYLPKRYMFDTGILRYMRETAVPSIDVIKTLDTASRTPLGGVIENQTAVDLVSMGFDISGWKKSPSGMEIDFVVKRRKHTIPIECKATLQLNKKHLKGLIEYLNLHQLSTGVVVSLTPLQRIESHGKTIFNLPLYMPRYLIKIFNL